MDGFYPSRAQIIAEIAEKSADLTAFSEAREIIRRRVMEVKDSSCQLTPLPNWSGTDAVLGSLDLAIHAMERTLDELRHLLQVSPPERPVLQLVKGAPHE